MKFNIKKETTEIREIELPAFFKKEYSTLEPTYYAIIAPDRIVRLDMRPLQLEICTYISIESVEDSINNSVRCSQAEYLAALNKALSVYKLLALNLEIYKEETV